MSAEQRTRGRRVFARWTPHACVFVAAYVLVYFVGVWRDRQSFGVSHAFEPSQRIAMRASEMLASGVCVLVFVLLLRLIRALRSGDAAAREPASIAHRRCLFLGLFAAFFGVMLLWFLGEYPGHLQTDQCEILRLTQARTSEPWLSTLYCLWALAWQRSVNLYPALALPNMALLAFALADTLSLSIFLVRRSARGAAQLWRVFAIILCVALLLASIPLGLHSIHLSHDTLTAGLKLCVVSMLARWFLARAIDARWRAPAKDLVLAGLLALLAAYARRENLVFCVSIAAVLALAKITSIRNAVAFAGCCVVCIALRPPLERLVTPKGWYDWGMHRAYQLTIYCNPIGAMVQHKVYGERELAEVKTAVDKVLDWDALVNKYTPFDIPYYWSGRRTGPYAETDIAAVRGVYVRAALAHPALFLGNRATAFFASFSPGAWKPINTRRENATDLEVYGEYFLPVVRRSDLRIERGPTHALARTTRALREWSIPHGFTTPGHYVWNAFPSLALVLAAACAWGVRRVAGGIAWAMFAPLALVFLFSPSAHFKYILDIYVLGFLIVPLWLAEGSLARGARAERS